MQIKIVIWDLDDTFWKGTLSEGLVFPIKDNIYLVKALVDRGIMNSIVSKNDYDKAMKVLQEWDVDKYFIFPKISWQPKGQTVKNLLEECGLRAENALFVDDNPSNLEEVKFYNSGIKCLNISDFSSEILKLEDFKGKIDTEHTRLAQYKILEKRTKKKNSYSSNEEFLRASNIRILINDDCASEIDRIVELVSRTNQLNYTKNRMSKEEITSIIENKSIDCAFVEAKDDFGDYGIVGFYAIKKRKAIHFLFSCRVLGFGIENYIYSKLGYPEIEIVGDVTVPLKKGNRVDWISEINTTDRELLNESHKTMPKGSILFIGGCDLAQAVIYLKGKFDVRHEFSTVIDGREYRTSDTYQLIGSKEFSDDTKDELCMEIPFMNRDITFKTELFDGKYQIIVLSLVDDFIRGVYRNKENPDFFITYGAYWSAEGDLKEFSENETKYLLKKFYFDGREKIEDFKKNIEKIISSVGKCKLILVNGIELDVSDWIGKDRCNRNIEMNSVIDEVVREHQEIGLVDMRKIVVDKAQCIRKDNRHFDRKSYYLMAQEIIRQSRDVFAEKDIGSKSMISAEIYDYCTRIKRKIIREIKKYINKG